VSEIPEEPEPQPIRERLEVCELDRARMSLLNPTLIDEKKEDRTIDENVQFVLVETPQ
jgi:carbon-monoxide dehydrogenase catalytic subunit